LDLSGIKNIIFDLGGIIIDLDTSKTESSFLNLVNEDQRHEIHQRLIEIDLFHRYERGWVSDSEFLLQLQGIIGNGSTTNQITEAWNAMLLEIPPKRLKLVASLKENHGVFVLSNTNQIHLDEFNRRLKRIYGADHLDQIFHKAYYSHKMGYRKPEKEIFLQVLEDQDIKPDETLFIDDNSQNIEGAQAVGLKTLHVIPPDHILNYF